MRSIYGDRLGRKPVVRILTTAEVEAHARNEMQLYDSLGPLLRRAIDESPLEIRIGRMLMMAPMTCFNPETGQPDDALTAEWLRGQYTRKLGKPWRYFVMESRRASRTSASAR